MATPTVQPKAEFFLVSWDQLHKDCCILARMLGEKQKWRGVVAVARGGLVPAAIIAHELNLQLVDAVSITSYQDTVQGDLKVLKGISDVSEDWLIIDDLVDTGKTAMAMKKMLPQAHLATVYAKPAGKPYTDTYLIEVPQDVWIVFPWETPPSTL